MTDENDKLNEEAKKVIFSRIKYRTENILDDFCKKDIEDTIEFWLNKARQQGIEIGKKLPDNAFGNILKCRK